jgi:hypothetical protein
MRLTTMPLVAVTLLAFQTLKVLARTCVDTYEKIQPGSSECSCLPGFSGPNCWLCSDDQACDSVSKGTKCATGFQYTAGMTKKAYLCSLSKDLQSLFEDGALGLACTPANSSCDMSVYTLAKGYQSKHAVDCNLTGCAFTGSTIDCKSLKCKCTDTCAALTKTTFEVTLWDKYVHFFP